MAQEAGRTTRLRYQGFLPAHHPVLGAALCRGVDHLVKVGAVHQVGGTAKEFNRGLLAERAFRAQHGNALR